MYCFLVLCVDWARSGMDSFSESLAGLHRWWLGLIYPEGSTGLAVPDGPRSGRPLTGGSAGPVKWTA